MRPSTEDLFGCQRDCVQPLHPGTGAPLHDVHVIAVRNEPILHLEYVADGKESQTEFAIVSCGHPLEIEVFESNVSDVGLVAPFSDVMEASWTHFLRARAVLTRKPRHFFLRARSLWPSLAPVFMRTVNGGFEKTFRLFPREDELLRSLRRSQLKIWIFLSTCSLYLGVVHGGFWQIFRHFLREGVLGS